MPSREFDAACADEDFNG